MDKQQQKARKFDWLPAEMPGITAMVKARRVKDGDAHVAECWRRGVLGGEPGWFFAREGPLAIGTPDPTWLKWPELENVPGALGGAMLMMRDPVEVPHGAHP